MKRFFGILMMVIAMMTVTTNVCAQAPNQKQRLSREQLAEKLAQELRILLVVFLTDIENLFAHLKTLLDFLFGLSIRFHLALITRRAK